MAGSVAITAPGSIGEGPRQGWSISEDVPSHVPTDGANSTGAVTFGAEAKSDSVFLQDNDSVFTVTKGDGSSFGLLAGKITSVSTSGLNANLSQGSALTRFNSDRYIPAVGSGSPVAALDLAMQLTGTKFCTLSYTGGVYWSARGHDVGFDVNNNPVVAYDAGYSTAQTVALLSTVTQTQNIRNSLTVSSYGQNTVRSQYMYGSSPTVIPGRRTMVMFTDIATNYNSFQVTYGPANYQILGGKNFNVYVDKTAQTVRIKGVYVISGGFLQQVDVSASITAPLTASANVQVLIDLNWIDSATFNITAYVANVATPGTYVTVTTGNLTTGSETYALRWNMAGIVQGIYQLDADQTFTPTVLMAAYENPTIYVTTGFATYLPDAPISPFNGTVWNYLSQVCSVTGTEVFNSISGNTTVPGIRPIGSISIAPESWVPTPTITVNNQGVGQNVQVKNYNTSVVSSKQIYDASAAGDSISFQPGTVTDQIITSPNAIELIFNPAPLADYPTFTSQQNIAINPAAANRANWVTNPDFELNVANWTASLSTLARVTSLSYTGGAAMQVTTTAAIGSGAQSNPVSFTSDWLNQNVAGGISVNAPTGVVIQVQLRHLIAAGSTLIASTNITGLGSTLWNRVYLSGIMASNATSGAYFAILTTTTGAPVFNVDAGIIEITSADESTLQNFTGNAISDINTTYGWNGQPNGSTSYAHPTGGIGSYVVSDSAGVLIDPYVWTQYGGNVQATLIDSTHIQLAITAPVVPGAAAGQYSLSARVGAIDYPTLSLVGSGVLSSPVTLNYATGADPKFVTALNAPSVDNVAVGSALRANTAAAFTSGSVSGPILQFGGSVNMDVFTGLSFVAGSTFFYQNQRWRIINSTIGNLTITITAIPYTTVGDFEAAWIGQTIGQFETFWAAYLNDDFNIQPLKIT